MYSKQVCVRERDQEDLYLAYSELKYYTHLCNAVEYCSKFSIPCKSIFLKKYLSIYLSIILESPQVWLMSLLLKEVTDALSPREVWSKLYST